MITKQNQPHCRKNHSLGAKGDNGMGTESLRGGKGDNGMETDSLRGAKGDIGGTGSLRGAKGDNAGARSAGLWMSWIC